MYLDNLDLIDAQIQEIAIMSPVQLVALQTEQTIEAILDDLESLRRDIAE